MSTPLSTSHSSYGLFVFIVVQQNCQLPSVNRVEWIKESCPFRGKLYFFGFFFLFVFTHGRVSKTSYTHKKMEIHLSMNSNIIACAPPPHGKVFEPPVVKICINNTREQQPLKPSTDVHRFTMLISNEIHTRPPRKLHLAYSILHTVCVCVCRRTKRTNGEHNVNMPKILIVDCCRNGKSKLERVNTADVTAAGL